jgi:hypothetical protein
MRVGRNCLGLSKQMLEPSWLGLKHAPEMITNSPIRVVFTEGGKGGVAKTEVVLSLIPWYLKHGIEPILFDFDVENTNKSGLQNFYPGARKIDLHKDGALDEFFDVCDGNESNVVVADMGAGAGAETYRWFDAAFEDARELNMVFTAIGVTTNDAGAVQSVLKWANQLQGRVDYVVVLNELLERRSEFEYWHDEPAVTRFIKAFDPAIMTMEARVQDLQAELRNQSFTTDALT